MELGSIVRELNKAVAYDLGYAEGDTEETNKWFIKFSVPGHVADRLVPNRPPDLESDISVNHDWCERWWKLPDGTIVSRSYADDDPGGGHIIPPDAGGPPPVKGYRVPGIPTWVPAE